MPYRTHSIALAIPAIAFTFACDVFEPQADRRDDLREAFRLWAVQGYDDYQYTFLRSSCECLPEWVRPYVIRVDDGVVVDVRDADTGATAPASFTPLTIVGLFAIIEDAIERDAHTLRVRYDRSTGYPTFIEVDYDTRVGDDEFTIHTKGLTPHR